MPPRQAMQHQTQEAAAHAQSIFVSPENEGKPQFPPSMRGLVAPTQCIPCPPDYNYSSAQNSNPHVHDRYSSAAAYYAAGYSSAVEDVRSMNQGYNQRYPNPLLSSTYQCESRRPTMPSYTDYPQDISARGSASASGIGLSYFSRIAGTTTASPNSTYAAASSSSYPIPPPPPFTDAMRNTSERFRRRDDVPMERRRDRRVDSGDNDNITWYDMKPRYSRLQLVLRGN